MFTASNPRRRLTVAAGLCLLALTACTDGLTPALPGSGSGLALSARMSVVGTSATTYTRVQLRILRVPDGAELALCQSAVTAEPPSSGWQIPCEVALDGPTVSVRVEVSLFATDGTSEYVAWSGEQGPIQLASGEVTEPPPVDLFPGPPENLSISALAIAGVDELLEEDGATLSVQVTGGPTSPQVLWATLDPEIATVTTAGRVEALQPGVARIVAAAGRASDTHEITVLPRPVGVEVTPGETDFAGLGETAQLNARVVDRRGATLEGHTIVWTIVAGTSVEHAGAGLFVAVANGESTVQASAQGLEGVNGSAVLRVSQVLTRLEVTPDEVELNAVGATEQLTLEAFDAAGGEMTVPAVVWSSADESVATVSDDGLVTAVADGSTSVTALVEGATAVAQIVVRQQVDRIEVSPAEIELDALEAEGQFTAVAYDAAGNVMDDVEFEWNVRDPAVASINDNGVVEAIANGRAGVTARADGARGDARVIVEQRPDHVAITPAELELAVNESAQLSGEVVDANGFTVPGEFDIGWSSQDPHIASVSSSGLVTGTGPGATNITAHAGVYTGTAAVSVDGVAPPAEGAGDIIVFNDVNVFDDGALQNPNNQLLIRNLVGFDITGPRAGATTVWLDGGRQSNCYFGSTCVSLESTKAEIAEAGYDFEIIQSHAGSLTDIPGSVRVIILWNPNEVVTPEEIAALLEFTDEGGRIIFVGEHGSFYSGFHVENQFLADMQTSLTVQGDFIDCGYVTLPESSLRPHQVTDGMTDITIACASRLFPTSTDTPLVFGTCGETCAIIVATRPRSAVQSDTAAPSRNVDVSSRVGAGSSTTPLPAPPNPSSPTGH